MNTPLPSVYKNTIFSTQNKDYIQNPIFNFSLIKEKENQGSDLKNNNSDKVKLFLQENNKRKSFSNSSLDSVNLGKPKCFINYENLKTNYTMKSVNFDIHVPFSKKDSNKNILNTVKKNLIPNLNDNNDIKCFLNTESKPSARSKYSEILCENKIINNYQIISELKPTVDINDKLDYILNSKKKKKNENNHKLLSKKRKNGKF